MYTIQSAAASLRYSTRSWRGKRAGRGGAGGRRHVRRGQSDTRTVAFVPPLLWCRVLANGIESNFTVLAGLGGSSALGSGRRTISLRGGRPGPPPAPSAPLSAACRAFHRPPAPATTLELVFDMKINA